MIYETCKASFRDAKFVEVIATTTFCILIAESIAILSWITTEWLTESREGHPDESTACDDDRCNLRRLNVGLHDIGYVCSKMGVLLWGIHFATLVRRLVLDTGGTKHYDRRICSLKLTAES